MIICGERGRRANVESHFCKHPTSENCSVKWNMTIEICDAATAAGLFTLAAAHTHSTPALTQTNIHRSRLDTALLSLTSASVCLALLLLLLLLLELMMHITTKVATVTTKIE